MSQFDLGKLVEQARQMQERLAEVQEQLGRRTVTAQAGGGMVVVTANGRQELVSVKIEPACVDAKDVGMLEDLVLAATNQALREAKALAEREMGAVAGGMLPPGMPFGT